MLPWKKCTEKTDILNFTKAFLTKYIPHTRTSSYQGHSTFLCAHDGFHCYRASCHVERFFSGILTTLKLCAVAEVVWHDNIFIEVIWMSIAVTLDLINDLVDRDDWCLLSISTGQFGQGFVHGSAVSVAVPFEVSSRAGFRFGCKICWVGPNGAWGQRFS